MFQDSWTFVQPTPPIWPCTIDPGPIELYCLSHPQHLQCKGSEYERGVVEVVLPSITASTPHKLKIKEYSVMI